MTRRKDAQPETAPVETVPTEPTPVDPPTAPFTVEVDAPTVDAPPREPTPLPPPPPPPRRSGVLGPLLGGAIAALGGFALSHFNAFGLTTPAAPVDLAPLTAQIEEARAQQASALDKISGDLAQLSNRVAKLEGAPAPDLSRLDALDQRLAAIEAMPSDGTASTAALTAKIAELEQRIAALPAGGSDPALQQKLDDALARMSEAEAAATARATEAEAAAAQAARDKALDTLSDLVVAGQPFTSELQALSDPALTEALGPLAETGVPTLASLQESFPDAARQALQVARDLSTETGWSDRLVDFLASQTGARPLTPREGTTPDAILSRAEFALSEGRVADALAELDPLDPAVKAPLGPWITQAKDHLAAAAALQTARGK
ncbi:MAG: hypothetical protein U1E58_14155 [Tabrizicola sp.]